MKIFDEVIGKEVEIQGMITPSVGEEHPHEDIVPQIDYKEVFNEEVEKHE
jgi:hypothetical protein